MNKTTKLSSGLSWLKSHYNPSWARFNNKKRNFPFKDFTFNWFYNNEHKYLKTNNIVFFFVSFTISKMFNPNNDISLLQRCSKTFLITQSIMEKDIECNFKDKYFVFFFISLIFTFCLNKRKTKELSKNINFMVSWALWIETLCNTCVSPTFFYCFIVKIWEFFHWILKLESSCNTMWIYFQ